MHMKYCQHLILLILILGLQACNNKPAVPSYLVDYESSFLEDPRQANLKWFKNADYGMFIHYGLYSLLEKGEWVPAQGYHSCG